ncbi:MAG: HAMP domain-containing protein, partial [Anaerolineae bacterium]|nr:HAMP domain-containing protein [Anaerolineae bacterium]
MSDFRPFFSFGQSFFGAMMQRLDSLRVKLFMAIAGANVVLVMVAYAIYGWSFDQGLVDYLNRADEARLSPLVTRLADGYRRHGDWRWISEDRQQWHDLVREVLGVGRMPRRGPEEAKDGVARPRPPVVPGNREGGRPPLTIDPRLLLLDARRDVLLGPAERAGLAVLRPIKVGEQIVGYLGYVPRLQVVTSLEQIFLTQQNRRFAAIALGLLAAVLLNAALIAHWLSRRLHALSDGAAALAQGDYAVRIPVSGHDELAQLAVDFNHLAQALEAAQRMRQQWIADIAHELRTPL